MWGGEGLGEEVGSTGVGGFNVSFGFGVSEGVMETVCVSEGTMIEYDCGCGCALNAH